MKRNKQELDAILDRAIEGIRRERLDGATLDGATSRVWARVAEASATTDSAQAIPASATVADHISGCADYQSLIPAYLRGELKPARRLLLEDHTHECVPCRKALKDARQGGRAVATRATRKPVRSTWTMTPAWRMAMAASIVAVLGFAGYFVVQHFDLGTTTLAATLESANGAIYKVTGTGVTVVAPGEKIKKGEHVRAAKESNAVLKLADGSQVEMRERSEFYVTENGQGTTLHLERGDVIIEAAKQIKRHLFVSTPDSLVSVTGTTFAVAAGTKGSRVSVVEGEVHFNHASSEQVLRPGDQGVSNAAIERVPVRDELGWSRNAAKYASLVTTLSAARKDLDQNFARVGVRYSSRFLDLAPENTVLYAALPNISEQLAESHKIMQERIKQNPALAEWWGKTHSGANAIADDKIIERVREFGSYLGDEIVVAAGMDAKGEPSQIVVLGELKDAAGFRPFAEKQLAEMTKDGSGDAHVTFVDDPATFVGDDNASTPAAATKSAPAAPAVKTAQPKGERLREEHSNDRLYVWVSNDLFVASPKLDALRTMETNLNTPNANGFVSSSFHQRLAEVYKDGAGLIVAADLEKIVGQALAREEVGKPDAERHMEGFRQLGLLSLKHVVVEQKQVNSKTQSRAVLTFNEQRRGIASWLAAPGPMGALEFVSPNANVATAFVVKEPALLVDDLFGFMETVAPDARKQLRDLETQQGFDIKRDFAAPLGGEYAFAIDGPILPTPSWKMILEVYDQPKLQGTFERVVDKLNGFAAQHGQKGLAWENTTEGAQTYYKLRSVDFGFEVNYTYSNGYMIVAPTKAMLQLALQYRESGTTLLKSQRFTSALPADNNANFSAIFYHDLAGLMQPLASGVAGTVASQLPEEQRKAIAALAADAPPTLAYAYAQGDRITIAANTEGGPFGLGPSSILGLPNSFAMQNILMQAMGGKGAGNQVKAADDKVRTIDEKVKAMDERVKAEDAKHAQK
ncbi:MAG: FecR domain-containing protein [Pyrinomonadaceae bacterium]